MRPTVFQVGGTLYWTLLTRNPDTGVLKDADSTPSVAVRKNGSSVGDSVTVTKRSATTGIYDCSYNPAGEGEGDSFTLEESATVTGTTTSSATYNFAWNCRVIAVERGTDSAALASGVNVTQIGGDAQSLADLKDFADAGYDPTTNKVNAELDSASQQTLTDLGAMITGSGTADVKFDTVALSNAPGGGGLTGPFTRTITVTDAADDSPIEAAKVRLYRTGETETKPTEADGQVEFTTEAATFSYAVTANGYGGASGTIVISANGSTAIELTATSVTPPTNPALSAIEVLCLDEDFEAASGIDVDFRMASVASGDQNRAHPGAKKTVTSNGSGIARFEGPQGATIEWKRGSGQVWTAVTLDNDSVTNVTSLIGSP